MEKEVRHESLSVSKGCYKFQHYWYLWLHLLNISMGLWKGKDIALVLSIKSTLEQPSATIIGLCVLQLPGSIEQTEWPAESCLSSSPGSLLSLTASTPKHLSWDKSNSVSGEAPSKARVNFVPGEMKRSWNWSSGAIGRLNIGLCAGRLIRATAFTSVLHDCACNSGAFDQVY